MRKPMTKSGLFLFINFGPNLLLFPRSPPLFLCMLQQGQRGDLSPSLKVGMKLRSLFADGHKEHLSWSLPCFPDM